MIEREIQDSVAILKLNRSTANPLNLEFVEALGEALREVKSNSQVRALVLSSSNEKFFSIGFDIPELYNARREDFMAFYRAFNRACLDLYTMPMPTVAAIIGHAIAGGCILSLCCDYRLIAEGRKLMSLNEVKLGVPVPYLADCILRSIVGDRFARDVMESGELFDSQTTLGMGMVDDVLPQNDVLPKSIERARTLGSYPVPSYRMIKRHRTEPVERRIRAQWSENQQFLADCWFSEETQKNLRDAIERFRP